MSRSLDGLLDMQLRQAQSIYITQSPCPTFEELSELTGASVPSIKLASQRDDWKKQRADHEAELIAELRSELMPSYMEKSRILLDAELELKREFIEKGRNMLLGFEFKSPEELIEALTGISNIINKDIATIQPLQLERSRNPTNPAIQPPASNPPLLPAGATGNTMGIMALIYRGTNTDQVMEQLKTIDEPKGTINEFYENTIPVSDPDANLAVSDRDNGTDTTNG